MTTAVVSKVSEADNANVNDQLPGCQPDIPTFRETTFDDHLADDRVVTAFALRIGECTGLLGATLENITLDSPGNTDRSAGCDEQGGVAVVPGEELPLGDA